MPDLNDRDELEKKLKEDLEGLYDEFAIELYAELEQAQWNINQVSDSVWSKINARQVAIMLPIFDNIFRASSETLLTDISIDVDWGLVDKAAADWARSYSTFLAGQIDATSRERVADALRNSVATYFEEGLTQGDLVRLLESDPDLAGLFTADVKDRLGRVYGPRRAQMIARTETTRAAAHGEDNAIAELRRLGIRMDEYWYTRNDELVCPICGPRNGKRRGDGWYEPPPAHPNCRCGRRYQIAEE